MSTSSSRAKREARAVDAGLRQNVLEFYRDLDAPFATKKDRKEWRKTLEAVEKLKQQTVLAAQ